MPDGRAVLCSASRRVRELVAGAPRKGSTFNWSIFLRPVFYSGPSRQRAVHLGQDRLQPVNCTKMHAMFRDTFIIIIARLVSPFGWLNAAG